MALSSIANRQNFSRIKEVVAAWDNVQQLLRSGEQGDLVPVVIPDDKRSFGWLMWFALAFYALITSLLLMSSSFLLCGGLTTALVFLAIGALSMWRSAVVEIEQGTTGVLSRYGKIEGTLKPGRHLLWWAWEKVEFIVDTSTEIPYTAPVLASPTRDNVPLKAIEFFLKFRIIDPLLFVRHIGASNFDIVLSSAVQDAIRRRSRQLETARAYDLRGSDVGDMQAYLNKQMQPYGVKITGANIPDVQLLDQYRENLATRERVSKEATAYEKEWELLRKRRTDTTLMEIERAKKERDEKLIAVREAANKAREDVAQMLQEREAEAEKIRLDIEAKGRAELKAAENEARALTSLGKSYQDNQAVLRYDLEVRRLEVAEELLQAAPRPIVVNSQSQDASALSTLLLAQILPDVMQKPQIERDAQSFRQELGMQNRA
ncbi:MAG TPA: SPFH domain-containing protein [Chloroflexi bacterium]|nr:MAG: peptidase [Anaerolineaceae bacterium 4572_5.2]HEY83783.1 SPFH domain-containing protein [Chloroflexota bacterium]